MADGKSKFPTYAVAVIIVVLIAILVAGIIASIAMVTPKQKTIIIITGGDAVKSIAPITPPDNIPFLPQTISKPTNTIQIQDFGDGRDGAFVHIDKPLLMLQKDTYATTVELARTILCTNGFRLFVSEKLIMRDHAVLHHRGNAFVGAKAGTLGGGADGGTTKHPAGLPSVDTLPFETTSVSFKGEGKQKCKGGCVFPQSRARAHYDLSRVVNANVVLDAAAPLFGGGSGGAYDQENELEGGGGGGVMFIAAKALVILDDTCSMDVSGGLVKKVYPDGKEMVGTVGGAGLIILHTCSTDFLDKLQFNIASGDASPQNGHVLLWKSLPEDQKEEERKFVTTQKWRIPPSQMTLQDGGVLAVPFPPQDDSGGGNRLVKWEEQEFHILHDNHYTIHARVVFAPTQHQLSGTVKAWLRIVDGDDYVGLQQIGPNPRDGQVLTLSVPQLELKAGQRLSLMTQQTGGHNMRIVSTEILPVFLAISSNT